MNDMLWRRATSKAWLKAGRRVETEMMEKM